jgi:hypothetical protein
MNEGTNIYALLDDTGEVRYVGKTIHSIEHRLKAHLRDYRRRSSTWGYRWVSQMVREGRAIQTMLLEHIPGPRDGRWKEAESFWINYCRFMGCRLTNIAAGGLGVDAVTPELLEVMRAGSHRFHNSPEQKALRGTPEYKQKMFDKSLEYRTSERHRARMSKQSRKLFENPENREKLSRIQKELFKNPEKKEFHAKLSRENWRNPEFKEMMREHSHNNRTPEMRKKLSEIQFKYVADHPERKINQSLKMKALWADPEYKARNSAIRREVWARRRAAQATLSPSTVLPGCS